LQATGVNLLGRLADVDGHHVRFADELAESVAWGDARYADFGQLLAAQLGGRAPQLPDPPPFRADTPVELNLSGFGAVIFTSGLRPDYVGWVWFPAFDSMGFPITDDGASTVVPGLYFCGVHFLRTRGSSLLIGGGGGCRGRRPCGSPALSTVTQTIKGGRRDRHPGHLTHCLVIAI
jgi:putative flavoprotein involved in K+ transport